MSFIFNLFRSLVCFVFLSMATLSIVYANEGKVTAIVSDRSASTLVSGAHQLLQQQPEANIQIRTVSQLNSLNDNELQQLLDSSGSVLIVGVFGDAVERLLSRQYKNEQKRYVLHSDQRLSRLNSDLVTESIPEPVQSDKTALSSAAMLKAKQNKYPAYQNWLQARAYWVNRSTDNARSLLDMLLSDGNRKAEMQPVGALRFALHQADKIQWLSPAELAQQLDTTQPVVWLLDHDTGDLTGEWQLHQQYCQALNSQCISVLAAWGEPSVEGIQTIKNMMSESLANTPWGIVSLQDFVIGGGDGREQVEQLFIDLNVPVLKGIRITEMTQADYVLSAQGIPRDSIHYRIAMPELQGVSQPQILALSEPAKLDQQTGAQITQSLPLTGEINRQAQRLQRWLDLQQKDNAAKRVAIIYYNHPPGRHNIGADNLNVPESLLEILNTLKNAGYQTGELPADADALLDILQIQGVNLPEDAEALSAMSKVANTMTADDYQKWFKQLPATVQAEMIDGPLAALQQRMHDAIEQALALESVTVRQAQLQLLAAFMQQTTTDIHHALDGLRHPGRSRALDLLSQLEHDYQQIIDSAAQGNQPNWQHSESLHDALLEMQIEGIRGWGEIPGKVMVWDNQLLIPGVQFGNVFIGPQPPRGWEIHEELLHANMSFPPPHQYLAFYHFIQSTFNADAMVHIGRHSTYEFLPKRGVGLGEDDYPSIIAGDVPGLYPYIVDGVGEGIQAKRRGQAVIIDHLTPPLAVTELYDDLLQLRQLIESAEAASDKATRDRAIVTLREQIETMGLRDELIASMDEELQVRGAGFDEIDDYFLLHEVGHYLTNFQETFMPLGLHVFGRDWSTEGLDTMMNSMLDKSEPTEQQRADIYQRLQISPAAELQALLNGLNGRFIAPGKGNDPIRTPDSLPTGRNFYALDGSLLPTRVGFDIGQQLAAPVLAGEKGDIEGHEVGDRNKQGVILWASDSVRDEGAMIAFGLKLLGVRPIWNSRGIIKGLERLPLNEDQPQRLDVLFTTSGLFRDLYGEHLVLLDKASLMALDASRDLIIRDYPALAVALNAALAPLGEWQQGGEEALDKNLVTSNWVNEARQRLAQQPDIDPARLGRETSLRVFGIAPGSYGAGINRLVERSSAWEDRSELADVFIKRMAHAYGSGLQGESQPDLFKQQLSGVSQTFLGRASNLYGLMDNNDAFDYLGGFNLAVEMVSGEQPGSAVINHSNDDNLRIDNLPQALLGELRARYLNPQWIKPLMNEGYAGARTMGSEFIEYLWGWQVTSPEIISDQVWEEVKAVYIDDSLQLGLDEFLSDSHRQHVQTNILAVMLVAIDKGFWDADLATQKQLAEQFAANIITKGIPGSGHTHANHPMYDFVKSHLDADQAEALEVVLARSRMQTSELESSPTHIQELQLNQDDIQKSDNVEQGADSSSNEKNLLWLWTLLALSVIVAAGLWRGRKGAR
ncbi:cobaltochelatase subunit CobN [Methylophaga sp.]|uniref:cobaltochelatase subunit CobN n=1 Tax=Methylophaga sp. TaxID=2024840 RepID=UPI00271CA5E3|nr:cobaltochelatase subunit CobN [Methylophaga sp.]MDO8827083.1 cobaltochelatase subunit CobN [Methylophaga sp.]